MIRYPILIVAGVLLLGLSATVVGQARLTGADLRGTVTDQTGAAVPRCTITVTKVDTNISRTVTTDPNGHYIVPALPPGTYTISAALPGFRTQSRERIDLLLGQAITVDFALTVVTATEVTVTASVPLVSPSRTEISSVITQRQIEQLPVNGRNFIGFAVITPGVSTDRTPLQGAAATSGLSFNGQRARSNNVMVDGLDNNDPVVGAVRATFSQEAVREFQVLTNSYSAEFGKAAGGVVNIVTKSGTNTFHGNAFLFFRDRTLNAKNYFDKFDVFATPVALDKPPFKQKQWGGTLGGPIQENKAFFFLAYERTDIEDARLVTIVPAAAAALNRAGFPVETGNVPLGVSNSEVFGKIDHQWTTARALAVRGSYADIEREGIDDFGGIVARSRGTVQLRTNWSLSAAETDVLSSRWLNELRAQFAYENQKVNALDPACGGPCTDLDQGGPTVDLTGVAAVGRQRTSPQLRLNRRVQLLDTVSYFAGPHHFKAGGEFNHLAFPSGGNVLPGYFGGRYIFSAIPALGVGSALDALEKGIPAAYIQGYGNPLVPDAGYRDLSVFAQDEWRRGRLVVKPGVRYQRQFWKSHTLRVSDVGGGTLTYPSPTDGNDVAPRIGVSYDVTRRGRTIVHGSYGAFFDNTLLGVQNIGQVINGAPDGVRTLVLPAPLASIAWNAAGHRLTEDQASALLGGSYVSVVLAPDPSLKNGLTHQASAGIDRAIGADLALSINGIYVRGVNLPGTIDYNPALPAKLGPGRRPNDLPCSAQPAAPCVNGGIPGTSASVLQFTGFGESWYRGLTVALNKRLSHNHEFLLSYTLSKAEDSSTDFQANFIPQNNGYGRNPDDRFGLPLGFDPDSERGPATHDQRHRFVLSGAYQMPWELQLSGILTAASGRPFTALAGADLNGDGNGGAFPPDRARRDPATEASSVGRNSETTVAQVNFDMRVGRKFKLGTRGTIEALLEGFNLFNRANFIEDTNQSSFVVFGSSAFPTSPLPAYGRYTLTLPPRQVQLAAKISF
jgi:hypothetical protein